MTLVMVIFRKWSFEGATRWGILGWERRRKPLVVCGDCHGHIHEEPAPLTGRPLDSPLLGNWHGGFAGRPCGKGPERLAPRRTVDPTRSIRVHGGGPQQARCPTGSTSTTGTGRDASAQGRRLPRPVLLGERAPQAALQLGGLVACRTIGRAAPTRRSETGTTRTTRTWVLGTRR